MSIEFKENAVCYADGKQWFFNDSVKPYKLVCNMQGTSLETLRGVLNFDDFQLNEPRQGDYIPKSELDTERKYSDAVEVFGLSGFEFGGSAINEYHELENHDFLICYDDGLWQSGSDRWNKRLLNYNQLMAIGKLKRLMNKRKSTPVSKVNRDIDRAVKSKINAELDKPVIISANKYEREISDRQGNSATVDVYDVLKAFEVTCPATQHAVKKLLCSGIRGHKDLSTDLIEAKESIVRAIELNG